MTILELKQFIEGRPDDEQVYVAIWERDDANNQTDFGHDDVPAVTNEQWAKIVSKMHADDGIWDCMSEAFSFYVNEATTIVVTVETK